jgi:hypothetical protein
MTEKIAAVIDSFDEEGQQPANYVVELVDGGFEARVWDITNACELTLGTCNNLGEATCMVWAHRSGGMVGALVSGAGRNWPSRHRPAVARDHLSNGRLIIMIEHCRCPCWLVCW